MSSLKYIKPFDYMTPDNQQRFSANAGWFNNPEKYNELQKEYNKFQQHLKQSKIKREKEYQDITNH